jgi:hypothetical protein
MIRNLASRRVRAVSALFAAACLAAVLGLPAGAPAQSGGDWAGAWSTSYGAMVLTQTGNTVQGTYTLDSGQISGTVSGDVLTGRWTEAPTRQGPNDAGAIRFTMSADRSSFTGVWDYDGDATRLSHTWNGARTSAPAPVIGKSVNAATVSGVVLIKTSKGFEPLGSRQIPVKSVLDTTKGEVSLTTARNAKGATQSGRFAAGLFQVLQSRKTGLTDLKLTGSLSGCGKASASARRKTRKLRSNAKGRFRTRGRYSAATVRGTKWDTTDSCKGTLTRVRSGTVSVRDFPRRKTVTVRAGKSYLAKARR